MSRILITLLTLSTLAFASGAGNGETDIIQRTVNFVLFAGLIWYLVAEPIKAYFNSRSDDIASELTKVQDKLNETIALKKEALSKISDAEKFAEELLASSKKENKIINDKMMEQCDVELKVILKQHEAATEFEQRRMVNTVVENILNEVLSQSSKSFDKKAMASVILKKVA